MNRRGFLGGLIGAASSMVLDPEKLLWVPGAKTFFIPGPQLLPAPRIPIGVMIPSGRVVFADEFYVTESNIGNEKFGRFSRGHFLGEPTQFKWIQIEGVSKVFAPVSDYLPSLAT